MVYIMQKAPILRVVSDKKICWAAGILLLSAIVLIAVLSVKASATETEHEPVVLSITGSIDSDTLRLDGGIVYLPGIVIEESEARDPWPFTSESNTDFTVTDVRCEYADGQRVTPFAYEPCALGAGISVCCQSFLVSPDNWSDKQCAQLLKELASEFELEQTGWSAVTDSACFRIADTNGCMAIEFQPKYYVISGSKTDGSTSSEFEAWFPCVNHLGCVDGLYTVRSY